MGSTKTLPRLGVAGRTFLLSARTFERVMRCALTRRQHAEGGDVMATGTVKWFNDQKGYGFIQPDAGGKDVFVHISAVERSGLRGLAEGQKISYEVQADRRSGKESAVDLKTLG